MGLKFVRFCALLFVALTLTGSLAHLLALPNKMDLGQRDYFTVQQIYRGWTLFGAAVAMAILFTLIQAILVRHDRSALGWTVLALGCICAGQVLFWTYNYPATDNWTQIPAQWIAVRMNWHYAHAASAGLTLIAHMALVMSILGRQRLPRAPKERKVHSVFAYPALPLHQR